MILDDRIADIDSPARTDMLVQGRLLESDGRNQRIGLLSLNQVHFQMLPLGSHQPGVAAIADAARNEHRRVVARAERLEAVQRRAELRRDIAEQQLGVDRSYLMSARVSSRYSMLI